jgi:hypothetical protein
MAAVLLLLLPPLAAAAAASWLISSVWMSGSPSQRIVCLCSTSRLQGTWWVTHLNIQEHVWQLCAA